MTEETKTIWGKKPQKKIALLQLTLIVILVGIFAYALYHLIATFRLAQLYVDNLTVFCIVACIFTIIISLVGIIIVLKVDNTKWVGIKFKVRNKYFKEEVY